RTPRNRLPTSSRADGRARGSRRAPSRGVDSRPGRRTQPTHDDRTTAAAASSAVPDTSLRGARHLVTCSRTPRYLLATRIPHTPAAFQATAASAFDEVPDTS